MKYPNGKKYVGQAPKIKKKRSKYGNKRTKRNGHTFDSLDEADYYNYLKVLQATGEITDIQLQPTYELQPKFEKNGEKIKAITYRADFLVTYKDGHQEIVDVKGVQTEVFKLKRKLFEYRYQELNLKLIKKSNKGWQALN